jgi:GT2 family glycosyltransferase/glycosyltransferase involved in cell wall biosynthesis
MRNIPIEIIIPVYNAPERLQECVESIFKCTDEIDYIIRIINDCSPDPGVEKYLKTIENHPNVSIIRNEKNLGFVGSVNKGMSIAEGDVVLLNSDTIVTKNWLKKMKAAAYSHGSIATVTPFTNNGTVCSIPEFDADNELPEGFTIESFARYVEKVSERLYPEIPTGVGFCMYIKWEVLKDVGLFDEEAFGKGYGEENDFCFRASEKGYIHVVADDTYIFHKGSMSFKGEKFKLIETNLKKLNTRYPYYDKKVHAYVFGNNPLRPIHETIRNRMEQSRYMHQLKGNILFVLHNFFDQPYNHPIGGTEFHVMDIVHNLDDFNAYVLVSGGHELILKHYRYGKEVAKYRFGLAKTLENTHFRHREYADIVDKIINTFEIDLVHIHHLIKHSFDIPYVAKKYGIPVFITFHDFYYICPRINLLDENNKYCFDIRNPEKCWGCLRTSHEFHTHFLETWKTQVKNMLANVDMIFVPSESTKKLYIHEYPEIGAKIRVIEHGIQWNTKKKKKKLVAGQKVKIGILGGISAAKGSDIIYEVITNYHNDSVEWHFIGLLGDQRLNLMERKNVIKHGQYRRDELSGLLERIDVDIIALWSPWPETYSYTLSEAWNCGIPVLVTPMGALKERVEKVGGGWVCDSTDPKDIMKYIDDLLVDFSTKYEQVCNYIANYQFISVRQMAEQYAEIYRNYTGVEIIRGGHEFSSAEIKRAMDYFCAIYVNQDANKEHNEVSASHENSNYTLQLENELRQIKSTVGYKVLEKLRRDHNWVLKIGKKVIYLALKYKRRK